MTRIECNCKICTTNAARLGKSAPLAALIPASAESIAKAKSGVHGLVYSANDPTVVGERVRALTGIQAG